MRAETERLVEEIEKSLALLRQRLGWDTAAHRLEELNAMTEAPVVGTRSKWATFSKAYNPAPLRT